MAQRDLGLVACTISGTAASNGETQAHTWQQPARRPAGERRLLQSPNDRYEPMTIALLASGDRATSVMPMLVQKMIFVIGALSAHGGVSLVVGISIASVAHERSRGAQFCN